MKRMLLGLAALATLLAGVVAVQVPSSVLAAPKDEVCNGLAQAAGGSLGCADDGSLSRIIGVVINIFSIVIGIVAVIMVMVSGYKLTTAGGDSSKVSNAKSTLVYAIVGLVVAALSQGLVHFVLFKIQ